MQPEKLLVEFADMIHGAVSCWQSVFYAVLATGQWSAVLDNNDCGNLAMDIKKVLSAVCLCI